MLRELGDDEIDRGGSEVVPALVDRFQRAAARELASQVARTVAAGAGACPDLRRAKNI